MTASVDPLAPWDLTPVINVSGTMTSIGASRVEPEIAAVADAILQRFVSMDELQAKASDVKRGREQAILAWPGDSDA